GGSLDHRRRRGDVLDFRLGLGGRLGRSLLLPGLAWLTRLARRTRLPGLLRRLGLLLLLLLGLLLLRLVLLLAAALRAIAVATVAAAIATVAALVALVAAARLLRTRRGLRRQGGFATAEEAEDAVPQAHATGLHRGHRLRGRGFLARLAHRCRLRRAHVGHRGDGRYVEIGLGQRDGRHLARGAALVTGLAGLFAQLVRADASDLEVRRVQLVVGDDHDRRVMALLDFGQGAALL